MPAEIAIPTSRSPPPQSHMSLDSPRLTVSSQAVTINLLEQVLLKVVQQIQNRASLDELEATIATTENSKSEEMKEKNLLDRASRLEYAVVNEIWDQSNGYKIEGVIKTNNEADKLDQYVFILRKKSDRLNKDIKLYLDIKSEALRDVLREVLKGVPGLSLQDDMPTLDPNMLFHYITDLMSLCKNHKGPFTNPNALKHVDLLLKFMNNHFGSISRKIQLLLEQREISFELLWGLFKPNDLIYTTCPGSEMPRCVRFVSAEQKTTFEKGTYLSLECYYLGYDRNRFGEATINLEIQEFSGLRKIQTLDAFPLHFLKNKETVRNQLIEYGRKFVSLKGIHHQRYQGQAFYIQRGTPIKVHVVGRVIVDASSFKDANPNYNIAKLQKFSDNTSGLETLIWGDMVYGSAPPLKSILDKPISTEDMQSEDLLICSSTVLGYSLKNKQWLEFAVAGLEDIKWDPTPFERLELGQEKKRVIKALVQSAESGQDAVFDDFVSGKGKGIISLLHGPPGVGKTLTAEGISEYLRKPLYSICAGELGNDPEKLEDSLGKVLHFASHWNAVLLLDEADVFLEQRSSGMHTKNSLVSVFLRMLEYFEGIMFLTTNRLRAFDEAILSRIHLPLRFDNLDKHARKSIWRNFLETARNSYGVADIKPKDLNILEEKILNGRQIKNIVRTGLALAKEENIPLAFSHLEVAIRAIEEFTVDFQGHGAVESLRSYS